MHLNCLIPLMKSEWIIPNLQNLLTIEVILIKVDIESLLNELNQRFGCSDAILWSESVYYLLYQCAISKNIELLKNSKSEVHELIKCKEFLVISLDISIEDERIALSEILKINRSKIISILSDNFSSGAIFVLPKQNKGELIFYLIKE